MALSADECKEGSFWEPGNYKRASKRIDDSYRLCDEFVKLTVERSEIEKGYAKNLKSWSKKWCDLLEKGPEYGSLEDGWRAVLAEGEMRCDLHLSVRDNLLNHVQNSIRQWQKDNFHKAVIHFKERKDIDDSFKKAQKPWEKLYNKVTKCRSEYHNACRCHRSAVVQEKNATGNESLSTDSSRKTVDRVSRSRDEMIRCKKNYETSLHEVSAYKEKYMRDMGEVYSQVEKREMARIEFFKTMLSQLQECLNISSKSRLNEIYRDVQDKIDEISIEKDLQLLSNRCGPDMSMQWPTFDDYSEEFREISCRLKKNVDMENNILLINQRSVNDSDFSTSNRVGRSSNLSMVNGYSNNSISSIRRPSHTSTTNSLRSVTNTFNTNGSTGSTSTESDEGSGMGSMSKSSYQPSGTMVRALYDYAAVEDDELSFKSGDVFEKLEDEDDQGWCKGRIGDNFGYFPANYVSNQ